MDSPIVFFKGVKKALGVASRSGHLLRLIQCRQLLFGRKHDGSRLRADREAADAYLHELARRTGGRYYRGDTMMGLSQAFAWIADELRRQYSLGYYPNPSGQEGQRRQIKVRVNRPNLVVATRDSYIYSQKKKNGAGGDERQSSEPASKGNQLGETD